MISPGLDLTKLPPLQLTVDEPTPEPTLPKVEILGVTFQTSTALPPKSAVVFDERGKLKATLNYD